MPRDVIIREVGPRDGLQLVETVLPTDTKLAWIRAMAEAGLPEIEICSFVPPHIIPQFADAADVVEGAAAIPGPTYSGLTPNVKGAQIGFRTGIAKINHVFSVSRTHNQANTRRTREQSLEDLAEIVRLRDEDPALASVKIASGLATALGCTLEGRVPEAETLAVLEQVLEIGVDEVMLPDTVGYAHPSQVRSLFSRAIALAGDVPVWSHFHDTRGLGLANAMAALEAGCSRFDATLAGLGGCPFAPGASGNIALEDLVFLMEAEGLRTGVDLDALAAPRALLADALPGEALRGAILTAGPPKGFQQREVAV